MLDKDTRDRIADYFDAADLVDYLRLKTSEIVDAFEVEIEDALGDIEELMDVRREDDE